MYKCINFSFCFGFEVDGAYAGVEVIEATIKDYMVTRCIPVHRRCHKQAVSNRRFRNGGSRRVASASFGGVGV
jgi:hypothetical protein